MFKYGQDIGIDLGTATVIAYAKGKGIVLREPSVVAVDNNTGEVLAVGKEARRMLGRTPGNIVATRPLRDGVISNYTVTEKMLKYFINRVCGNFIFAPRIMICIPSQVTEVEKKAVIDAASQAGARKVYLIEEPIAAAIGAGIDISKPCGNMVVDIGGGTTDIAVISLGGSVVSTSIKVAGDKFDEAIVRYIKKKYNINLKDADESYKLDKKWDGLAQHIAAVVHGNTDITILTIFSKLSEVSVYSVYAMITKGVKSIISAFSGGIDASFGDMIAKNEKDTLNKSFSTYELFYFTIITICYSCTILLIVPFVGVYMKGVTDANYIRPLFGYLLVISEFIWAIRMPYSSITLAAGHFKETRKGAWVEAISNIVISIILVIKFGIVGVAIGTLVAMLIRTIEFIYHTNKYILNRNIFVNIKKVIVIILETILIVLIVRLIPINITINSYLNWIIYAIIVFVIASIVTISINMIMYKNDIGNLKQLLKNNFGKLFKRRKK